MNRNKRKTVRPDILTTTIITEVCAKCKHILNQVPSEAKLLPTECFILAINQSSVMPYCAERISWPELFSSAV